MKPARSKDIARLYSEALAARQAFVAYRLPDTHAIRHLSGDARRTLQDGESAFAFAPFDPSLKPYYIIQGAASSKKNTPSQIGGKLKSTSEKQFKTLVKGIIADISQGKFTKVVAARILAVARPSSFDPVALFERLCSTYQSAFVSLTYIPGVGLWIGASPEVLVSESATTLSTYSLAGTKAIEDSSPWTPKEIAEQQIVTDFIHDKLRKTVSDQIKLKGPKTHEAGSIKHLLSVFRILHSGNSIWRDVAKALHPTPAVSGMPQQKAVSFITEQESFDRAFYAGYLGPVNQNGKTNLFVNLRCVEVRGQQLVFYAGCGITADSDPQKEWQESVRKIDVLKSLI